ncbi:MAG TPA: Spy/CpxP family protein refolding chaperone [Stellaceae bacterium]|nr:Spy/CpxP family protein refolding chaperone [Stellaceae bacterium]
MNRSLIAGAALLLGAAMAVPVVAWSADNPPQAGQTAASAAPAGPGQEGGPPGGMGMHRGPMGRPGMAGREGWRQRMMMRQSPQQGCINRMARRAGMIAYTLTKLNLTPPQQQAWRRVQATLDAAGERQRHLCGSLPASWEAARQQTLLDRIARRENFLAAHLNDLQQIQPSLQQFYQTLTPQQQAIVNHPFGLGRR